MSSDASVLPSADTCEIEISDDDRRANVRMHQQTGPVEAFLRVGQKKVPCTILDESAGGFLVSARRLPRTTPNVPVMLIATSGTHPLRVVWRRKEGQDIRLGLQRLPEGSVVWREDSSWLVWMTLALFVGFGVGYYFAFRENALKDSEVMRQIFSQSKDRIATVLAGDVGDAEDGAAPQGQESQPAK